MDKSSSSINQWTKGSNNDSKSTQKTDFNSKTTSNYNSFEFLDMSSCDETQKLKLKNTLNSPSSSAAFSTQRERYRSNFATRNSSIKPTPQQYSTIQYHANNSSKSQKPNYQFYQTKHPNSIEHDMRHVSISSRSFSSEANNFSSKNNSNFNNNISTLSNTTNISSKRLDDNRHYPNTWHSNSKKPPYVGLKDHPKELSRDSNKSFASRNMSPPLTNFQTNTTSTTTSSSPSSIQNSVSLPHQAHMSQYSAQQQMYPPIYPTGNVPLIQHYPIHAGYMPPGQPMIPPPYGQHGERNDARDDHQSSHPMNSTRGGGSGRRGRSRGGNNNNMSRRDYQQRQNNQHQQHQQSSVTSNEYGLMEQTQAATAVMSSGPYPQFYIQHYPSFYGPNAGAPHLAALPGAANSATAQNLTGQPLFAIQQPLHVYQYSSPYPIMYNMMPTQAHSMAHQQSDMTDNEHNQSQEPGGAAPVLQSIAWPHHVAYQEQHQPPIFQHSPHLSAGEIDLEYTHPDEYHLQMMNHSNNFQLIAPDAVESVGQAEQSLQQDAYVDDASIENETYEQDLNVVDSDTRMLVEKTRDLSIQTTALPLHLMQAPISANEGLLEEPPTTTTIEAKIAPAIANVETEVVKVPSAVDNKMIVKNKEKPPAWGSVAVPNLAAATSVKKQTASVSVSAIPNKDVVLLQHANGTDSVAEAAPSFSDKATHFPNHQSFSSITASKSSSAHIGDGKKTENKQSEIQPLQKQQQQALIDRAKQQIVTTITSAGGSRADAGKKMEAPPAVVEKVVEATAEKVAQAPKPSSPSNPSGPSRPSWAGLFNAGEAGPSSRAPSLSSVMLQNQIPETQKASTAKNPETLSVHTAQVPGVMSYSAVSAQSLPAPTANYAATVTTIPQQMSAGGAPDSKKLPQSKLNLSNSSINSINNHVKSAPVDQHALKLGDFFSKYKIESNSVSLLPRGLLNKSNYCYINAILQALVACPPFYHLMRAIPQLPPTYRAHTKTPVTDAMVELVSNYSQLPYRKWAPREKSKKDDVPDINRDTSFEPTVILKMLQTLRTDMFPVEGRQEDAEEFLSFILNRMNDEMIELKKLVEKPKQFPPKKEESCDDVNGNTDLSVDDEEEWQVISGTRNKSTITRTTDFGRSPISDIFGGKIRLRVHREGDHSSDNIEPFFTLKLVIEKASSVKEALEILVGRDQLEGVTCSRTNQEVAAWQQATLEELPVVLILHLKCFDFKKESCTKILKTVEFPVELKIDQKIMASKNKYQQKQKQYKLFAVVYHDGKEASKGHYITDVFHVGYSSWIRYDDSSVKAVPESIVLHPKPPRVPYLLYYRRYDTIGGNRDQRDHNCNNHQKSTK